MPPDKLSSVKTAKFAVLGFDGPNNETIRSRPHATTLPAPSINDNINKKYQHIFLDIDEPYTRSMIHQALLSRGFLVTLGPGEGMDSVPLPSDCQFQWSEYERIDWQPHQQQPVRASSYRIRKGLSRKAQLALYMNRHVAKHPDSVLRQAIPETVILDTWRVFESPAAATGMVDMVLGSSTSSSSNIDQRQLLHECLEAAKQLIQRNEHDDDDAVWILKGSTANKGEGIYIVHVFEQVLDICWDESEIREWVLQRYISPPLTLHKRKFHIRAYIVAVGALRVYFSNDCLVLLSGSAYRKNDFHRLVAHITNTAYQGIDPNFREQDCIQRWGSDTVLNMLVRDRTCDSLQAATVRAGKVLQDMHDIVSELFAAYETEFGVFSPIEDCFEHFGLDFVIDTEWQVYLLEVNPGPDFKQTGSSLRTVVENLMVSTIDLTLFDHPTPPAEMGCLTCVYDKERRTKET